MKKTELVKAIQNIPRFVAVFEVTDPPKWATNIQKGDVAHARFNDCESFHIPNKGNFRLGATMVKFVAYKQL